MKLQACTSCGAQFDVSTFAPGQKFTCGSCGTVLTAHAQAATPPAPAAPVAPAVSGRAPGSRRAAPSGGLRQPAAASARTERAAVGTRGPQYRPPERRQDPRADARATERRPQRGQRAARMERPARAERKGGPSPALIYGAGGLLVAGVLLFLVIGGGKSDASGGGATAGGSGSVAPAAGSNAGATVTASVDTLATVQDDLRRSELKKASDYHGFAKRFLDLGTDEGKNEAKHLYEELIRKVDPDDLEARKYLGYTDFQTDILGRKLQENEDAIPPDIANRRGYDYLDLVTDFASKRWLDDEDDIANAKKAVARMKRHLHLLETDHLFRLGDSIRSNIAQNPQLKLLNYTTCWKPPYLVCYSSAEEIMSEMDLRKIEDKNERKAKKEELNKKRHQWDRVAYEKAMIFQQLYQEFMRRYADRFGLKPLTDEYGGRQDYPPGVRSYPDGVPMTIWIFSDEKSFQDYHEKHLGGRLPPGVAGYFDPSNGPTGGWIFLFDEPNPEDRGFEINKTVHEGTHMLEYWFTRQQSKWGFPPNSQNGFSEGIAEFLGSVQMDKARHLKFIEVNVPRLHSIKGERAAFAKKNKDYPIFPVQHMMAFSSYAEMGQWANEAWGVEYGQAMDLFYQQVWAFTYFLNHFENGKYKDRWLDFFGAVLQRQASAEQKKQTFMRCFRIRDDDEWDEIESEWTKYMKDVIFKMSDDTKEWEYTPPGPDDWPEGMTFNDEQMSGSSESQDK